MLLQTALYLTSVLSAIALIALILIQDRSPARSDASVASRAASTPSGPSGTLGRATAWSAAIFLLSALGTAVADGGMSGSLLDELPAEVSAASPQY
ncbi:preprotein translocase subunit SecG [Engelhardtia mirabilis]|uniref:Protein-export membrane protein SecG n=1 Tax=Engelhardtia mirabilis TaxID=2528011 RepID=A0A518BRV0_9BACT|nr:preprotein translocase subunit SecG [Planctomycetes bacterium Pla133]QDV04025.1 preprotein translocase subunit SecG [Planctomycetes bacterium Pla86]